MDAKAVETLERIASESLEKCVSRLSRVSGGKWGVADSRISWQSMREAVRAHSTGSRGAGAAAYFEVKGEYPFTAMVVFRPGDIEVLCKGFLGVPFMKLPDLNQAQELLFSELGNIIFNSLVSELSNTMKRAFIPSAPKCVKGEIAFLLEALWASLDGSDKRSLVTVLLDLRCGDDTTGVEVIVLIPPGLEAALAAATVPGV
jgi:chemotaxis protein CheY-P-specific phosphatase CheC